MNVHAGKTTDTENSFNRRGERNEYEVKNRKTDLDADKI